MQEARRRVTGQQPLRWGQLSRALSCCVVEGNCIWAQEDQTAEMEQMTSLTPELDYGNAL